MALRRPAPRRAREPTIALINVVFLLQVFFLVAGTLAPPLDSRLTLVEAADLKTAPPPDGLVVLADGTLLAGGKPTTAAEAGSAGGTLRLVPDRDLPAAVLVAISRDLRAAGAERIVLVAERGDP